MCERLRSNQWKQLKLLSLIKIERIGGMAMYISAKHREAFKHTHTHTYQYMGSYRDHTIAIAVSGLVQISPDGCKNWKFIYHKFPITRCKIKNHYWNLKRKEKFISIAVAGEWCTTHGNHSIRLATRELNEREKMSHEWRASNQDLRIVLIGIRKAVTLLLHIRYFLYCTVCKKNIY